MSVSQNILPPPPSVGISSSSGAHCLLEGNEVWRKEPVLQSSRGSEKGQSRAFQGADWPGMHDNIQSPRNKVTREAVVYLKVWISILLSTLFQYKRENQKTCKTGESDFCSSYGNYELGKPPKHDAYQISVALGSEYIAMVLLL